MGTKPSRSFPRRSAAAKTPIARFSRQRRGRNAMTTLLREHEVLIADCLRQGAKAVRVIDGTGWKFELRGEVPLPVTARLKKGWLRLCSPLSAPSSSRPAPEILDRMLAQNVELAGGAKFTLADDPPLPCLAAEILLDEEEESDLAARISRACDGFVQGLQEFAGGQHSNESHTEDAQGSCGKEDLDEAAFDLVTLCKETGWPLAERTGNQVAVELDVPGCFCQALVQPKGRKGLHLGVDMECAPSVSVASRNALDVMLLHACHFLRLARATTRTAAGATAYGWEVSLDRVAGAREVEYALAALSVACRLSAREVSVFQQDESLARRYLMLRGWCS